MTSVLAKYGPAVTGTLGILSFALGLSGSFELLAIGSLLLGLATIAARIGPNTPENSPK